MHPYYLDKAGVVLSAAGAPDADPTPLAAWAEAERATGRRDHGVIVDTAGMILARTIHRGDGIGPTAWYLDEPRGAEVGLAQAHFKRSTGRDTLHVVYREVAEGPSVRSLSDSAEYLDTAGVAERLGIQVDSVRRMRTRGDLPPADKVVVRSPLWLPATIDAHIAAAPQRRARAGRPRQDPGAEQHGDSRSR